MLPCSECWSAAVLHHPPHTDLRTALRLSWSQRIYPVTYSSFSRCFTDYSEALLASSYRYKWRETVTDGGLTRVLPVEELNMWNLSWRGHYRKDYGVIRIRRVHPLESRIEIRNISIVQMFCSTDHHLMQAGDQQTPELWDHVTGSPGCVPVWEQVSGLFPPQCVVCVLKDDSSFTFTVSRYHCRCD